MMMSLFLDKSVNQFESNKENKHQKKEMTEEKHRSEFGSIQGYVSSRYMLTFPMVKRGDSDDSSVLERRKNSQGMTEVEDRSEFGPIQSNLSSRYVLTFLMLKDVTAMSTVCSNEGKTVKE